MFVLILFGVVACGAALWSMYRGLSGRATKKFLHFENGRLTVYYYSFPGMHEKTYALDQIREVRFTLGAQPRRAYGQDADRIARRDGEPVIFL